MCFFHVHHETVLAVFVEHSIIIIKRDRTDNHSCRVNRLRNLRIDQSIEVIEYLWILLLCCLWIRIELLLNGGNPLKRPRILLGSLIEICAFVLVPYRSFVCRCIPFLGEMSTNIVYDTLCLNRAKCRNSCGFVFTETFNDMSENSRSVRFNNVDINVADFFSVFITEPGENCIPGFWIEIDDVCDISDSRTANRSSCSSNCHSLALAPTNQFRH